MNQRGFATLEVILMVMVIGILASIAVPRFNSVTAAANTAKIQADLSTLDTAISLYYMDNGSYPDEGNITAESPLKEYIKDIGNLKPPTGSAYIDGKETPISSSATSYAITAGASGTNEESRATLDGKNAGAFTKNKNNVSGS